MRLRTKILIVLLIPVCVWLIVIQFHTYSYPNTEEIDKRLNYLERVINEPLHPDRQIMQLKKESYEFMLFTYAYSTYAATNLAVKDSTYKQRIIPLIRESIIKTLDNKINHYYSIPKDLTQLDSIPDCSVLYLGHLNLMLGCYRLISSDTTFNELNDKISASLYSRYKGAKIMNLESYTQAIWIPDNTVALASLYIHSNNTGSHYDSLCREWIAYAKKHLLEKETNVLYSTINPATGKTEEEPRGSMLGWSIMFIYQFDSDFAIQLYQNYKKHFSQEFLVFRLFKERAGSFETSLGDIDSGPIFLGYSIPANEFALGASILAGDHKTARKLERLISFGTKKIEKNDEIRYKVRFVDMNISPMAEALVLNSLTITKWVNE